jgi:hypothetical protein
MAAQPANEREKAAGCGGFIAGLVVGAILMGLFVLVISHVQFVVH